MFAPKVRTGTPTLRIGTIKERLQHMSVTAEDLRALGFEPAGRERAAPLYHEEDFPAICEAIAAQALAANPQAQVLVLVPEINLTPQLQERFHQRFAPVVGAAGVVSLHSGMTPAQRLNSWLAAHSGQARIVLGTRMAIFASLPHLALIVVDEEHDASYKQQEGARYSARDLALWRGRAQGAKVILGSATPSLESWHASSPEVGRYQRLEMPERMGAGALAHVRLVDMGQQHVPEPAIDPVYFPHTPVMPFWSSTPFAKAALGGGVPSAWFVDFDHDSACGGDCFTDRVLPMHVRLVRSGQ